MQRNPYSSQVNLQIWHAKQQLKMSGLDDLNLSKQSQIGFYQAACWYLWQAYQSYLVELAHNYKLGLVSAMDNPTKLAEKMESVGKYPSEANELILLEKNGFLGSINHYLQCLTVPVEPSVPALDELSIKVVGEAEQQELSQKIAESLIEQLESLINRQRELLAEY